MFENVTSIAELNKERVNLMQQGFNILELNSAYNRKRKELMNNSSSFRTINIHRPKVEINNFPVTYIPCSGFSDKLNTIELVDNAFRC